MEPTLTPGQMVKVDTSAFQRSLPHRGDLIVFRLTAAGEPKRRGIARIIGLPGEIVAVNQSHVYINGERIAECYVGERAEYTFGLKRPPRGGYFVLGDNRNFSYDSSKWRSPWLRRRDILGRVVGANHTRTPRERSAPRC